MRRITFTQLLTRMALQMGRSFSQIGATPSQGEAWAFALAEGYREAWGYHPWPESLRTQSVSLVSGQTAFPYASSGRLPLGEILSVWTENPWTNPQAMRCRFALSDLGVVLPGNPRDTFWVVDRPRLPAFTTRAWDAAVTYAEGETVWHQGNGDCWHLVSSVAAGQVPGANAAWVRVPVLELLVKSTLRLAKYYVRDNEEQNPQTALAAYQEAEHLLAREIMQLRETQRQGRYLELACSDN